MHSKHKERPNTFLSRCNSLEGNEGAIQRDRIALSSVFVVNLETVNSWESNYSKLLPGAVIRIPDTIEQRYQPMFFTKIRVYQNHTLKDYDSGLTSPRVLTIGETFKAGDTIQFYYELGSQPQLKANVVSKDKLE